MTKIMEKLSSIQTELKAPKNQFNSFGKYRYRSCEDILEAVKPLCHKYRATLTVKDDVILILDRYYIKSIATIYDWDSDEKIESTSFAREDEIKKGMDSSQVTGSASSYARKYALNGLFSIDDNKDADSTNEPAPTKQDQPSANPEQKRVVKASVNQVEMLKRVYTGENLIKLLKNNNIERLEDISIQKASYLIKQINEKGKQKDEQ